MSRLATRRVDPGAGAGDGVPTCPARRRRRNAARMDAATTLKPGWSMPALDGVTKTYVACPANRVAAGIGEALLEAGLAYASDWQTAGGDPHEFVRVVMKSFVERNGGSSIRKLFRLHLLLTTTLNEYEPEADRLYLTIDPSEAAYFVAGPTLGILEGVHPRLPATFFHLLSSALNHWIRVYDHRDAREHVEMLREWYSADPDGESVELPDVEASVPACLREHPLCPAELRRLLPTFPLSVQDWMSQAIEVDRIARSRPRQRLTEQMEVELGDRNPPLPSLLVVFKPGDNIEACFDAEAQSMMEVSPEPNLILPCDDLLAAFRTLQTVCQTLAKAAELIETLPEHTNGS